MGRLSRLVASKIQADPKILDFVRKMVPRGSRTSLFRAASLQGVVLVLKNWCDSPVRETEIFEVLGSTRVSTPQDRAASRGGALTTSSALLTPILSERRSNNTTLILLMKCPAS